jgi:hypothetical protein
MHVWSGRADHTTNVCSTAATGSSMDVAERTTMEIAATTTTTACAAAAGNDDRRNGFILLFVLLLCV